jgi:serine/threonine protein kinase/tetratricopeptide (TPR) repeat protein
MNRSSPPAANPAQDQDQVLADLVEQWTMQLQSGEAIDWQACARDYPQYAEHLRDLLPALQALAGVGKNDRESKIEDRGLASGVCQHPGAGSFNGGIADPARKGSTVPLGVLGDYRLVREIGRGGMGTVYEADQISLHRRVALKVLPFAAALDERQLQRFKTEAQAAAQLHHSNIVPVFAVGCEQGVHYYAMQFIEGQTLAQLIHELHTAKEHRNDPSAFMDSRSENQGRIDKSNLDIGSSLLDLQSTTLQGSSGSRSSFFRTVADLGIQAAEALEYAHQMGVVHRDIKPANLLIETATVTAHDSRLRLWITDFGLARYQTDAGLTGTGDVLGTVRYMSPEQGQGQRGTVDYRSDVYSLGATLYELLTLRPAFEGQSREEILAQLTTEDPVSPRQLNKAVPVELETIVLKSLAKRPEERYGSAQEFADDLRRFLEDKPILARRPSLADKARKWARRHKGLMRAAALIVVLGIVGLVINVIIISRERHETEVRRRQARRAVDEMYSQFAESVLSRQPGIEALEKEFLLKALGFYQEFAGENSTDPELRLETAKAFRRMGDIYYKLGQLDHAKEAFQEASDRLQPPARTDLESVPHDYRRELALTHNNRANVFRDEGRMSDAEENYRQAERLLEPSDGEGNDALPSENRDYLAGIKSNLGIVLAALGRPNEGEREYRSAQAMLERLAADHPASPGYRHDLADCMNNLGTLLTAVGRFGEAEKLLGQALQMREKLAGEYLTFPAYRQALAVSHTSLGALLAARSRYAEATQHYRQSQVILEKLAKDFPATPSYRQGLASNAAGLGCVLTASGKFKLAEESHRQALALRETLATDYPGTISSQQEVAASHAALGQLAFVTGKYTEAERAFGRALVLRQKLAADAAFISRYRHDLRASYHELANLLTCLGRLSEAEIHYREAIGLTISEASGVVDVFDRLELAGCQSDLAALLLDSRRPRDAEAELQKSLEVLRKLTEECPQMAPIRLAMCVGLDRLSVVNQNTGRKADAAKALLLALAMAEKLTTEMPANPDFRRQYARLQIRLGERLSSSRTDLKSVPQAEEALAKGMTSMAKLADEYPAAPEFRNELAQALDWMGCLLFKSSRKPAATRIFRQVRRLQEQLIRDFPVCPRYLQELAWLLATCPDLSIRDTKLALETAERAAALAPEQSDCWITLGVAHYRNGHWNKAQTALIQSTHLQNGGQCAAWLFLAMTCQRLGDPGQARQWFDKAVAWINQNQPIPEDLTRFRAEAEAVMSGDGRSAQLPIGVGGR